MNKAKRPCLQPGCPNLVESGYCDEHKRKEQERSKEESINNLRALDKKKEPREIKFYSSPAWRRTSRLYRLKHPLCERCEQRGYIKKSELVHHISELREIWRENGNPLHWRNLQALCRDCHMEDLRMKKYKKNKKQYKY